MASTMDAADLARWTRFAAKGGIGKCTAVQDCIAESPEDLMFLKDDEITVLMQLPGQFGRYLGYCEGVVGRFQGAHVRFHGKLKRPVMTKRQSSSAVSVASSPVPSATPSPRMPLAPLTGPVAGNNVQPLDRDSVALSDPFDLELDAPPKTRRSEEASNHSDSDGPGRRRLTRAADDLPGLEMFLPRSRSGSRSRPTSRPASRGQDSDDKNSKRKTRIVTQLTSSPHADSLDAPPSPLPPPSPLSRSQYASPEKSEVEIKVDEDTPQLSASPEPLQEEQTPEQDASSLYDAGSMRSSFYSTRSYRSSVIGAENGLSAGALNALGRFSQAESDDGGLGMGIGLSMLQDMADDDEEEVGAGEAAPPTPRIDKSIENTERKRQIDENESDHVQGDENSEDEDEEDVDDDESYWDGADIYDNYRYSRYSVMTKNSRRKSRFSMMSRYSVADPAPASIPPVPLDAETRLRSDSGLSSPTSPNEEPERRKHVPPPLTFVKNTPNSSYATNSLLSVGPQSATLSPTAISNRSTAEFSSDGHSPLLHTNFASPRTSSSHATSYGTDESDARSGSPSPVGPVFAGAGASNINGNGAASALRHRLENGHSASPTPLPSPNLVKDTQSVETTNRNSSEGPGKGIVVDDDDDEPVSVTVVPADESGSSREDDHVRDSDVRDSVQSTVSTVSTASIATTTSDFSDVSGVMRKMERDLASATASSGVGTGVTSPLNLRSPSVDIEGPRTPNAADFPNGPTQPLRLHDRAGIQPAPSPDLAKQQPAPLTPSPSPRQQRLAQPDAKPAERSQLLHPEQALFLPHPNAPRPNPAVLSGQRASMYGMPPVHEPKPTSAESSSSSSDVPGGSSLEATLRAASAARVGPAGIPHRPTIFGKTVVELSNADGPVPIMWSLQPFPLEPASRAGSPAAGGARTPRRSATASASPLSQSVSMGSTPPSPAFVASFPNTPLATPTQTPSASPAIPSSLMPGTRTLPLSENKPGPSGPNSSPNPYVLSRPNFSPRVGTARPRSRSFSDFAREMPSKPILKERASEEGSKPSRAASLQSLKASAGAPVAGTPLNGHPLRQSTAPATQPQASRGPHTPSPLGRPENNAVVGAPRTASLSKGISSPLGRSFFSSSQTQLPTREETASDTETPGLRQPLVPPNRNYGVRQVASVDNFKADRTESPLVSPPKTVFQPVRRNSGPAEGSSVPAAPVPTAPSTSTASSSITSSIKSLRRISSPTSKKHQRNTSQQSQASSNGELRSAVTSPPPPSSTSTTPSPEQRSNSVKSKLSLSHLRIRSSNKDSSFDTQTPSPSTGPATPVFEFDSQPETIQVQDAEFEMIRPTMRRVSSEPMSDDSVIGNQDERRSLQRESRVDSPGGVSVGSILSPIQSTGAESIREQDGRLAKVAEDASAHRARELKWMSTMSSVPPAQSRKSKKIRRLVLEGVPSSVRYLVWSHLTDSKAKRIPGVYGKLGQRGRVAASEVIERDAARCFPDQRHLQDPKGPLVGLLQTYLTMVPDIAYQTSLTLVAGHLLLQSPEEDAFWIFTSMMDLHLRAYFSSKSVQMEADALVFGKTVELLNPPLAKKLFYDLGIPPSEICRIWFSSLFATTLPQDYVNRIWDVYLCEGPPFLFRIGVAILACCRSAIESTSDRAAVVAFLMRPETLSLLPEDPEEFINIALAAKIKDEDVKKQRVKVEAHLKQQTQTAQRSTAPRLVSSISLPRAAPATPL